jgi:hypothetical protein
MCGVSKFNYLLRVIKPSLMREVARLFDHDITSTTRTKLEIDGKSAHDDETWKNAKRQIRLPTRMGGLGLPSQRHVSPIAYFSALAATVEYTSKKKITLYSTSSTAGQINKQTKEEIAQCLKDIRSSTEEKNILVHIPDSEDNFQNFYQPHPNSNNESVPKTKGLQHLLTAAMHYTHAVRLQKSGPQDKEQKGKFGARLNSVNAPKASTWLNTIPTESHLTLSDFQYRIAVRNRLGLKPLNIMPKTCADCGSELDIHCDHYLTCRFRRKNELNTRHDQVAKFIHKSIQIAGGCATLEPSHLERENRKRPDLDILLDGNRILADVSIVHPTAPSHYEQAAKKPLITAESMEKTKITKYTNVTQQHNCTFIPIVLESFGGMPQKCLEFISRLSIFSEQNSNLHGWRDIAEDLSAGIAIAIQRGNGMAAKACLISSC